MSRLHRICPVNIPQHIIQRGNNHQICFASETDFVTYAAYLKKYANKFEVDIHAWVFMTNHVHLLCTPKKEGGISNMMQSLGRGYVRTLITFTIALVLYGKADLNFVLLKMKVICCRYIAILN